MSTGQFLLQQLLQSSAARSTHEPGESYERIEGKISLSGEKLLAQRARFLNWIADRRSRGDAFSSIAASLNAQGVRGGYGGRWYSATVRSYLHRHAGNAPNSSKGE